MVADYTHDNGFRFIVFHSGHMDWGLEIFNPYGDIVYSSVHALSYESYGLKPHWRYKHLDDALEAESGGNSDAFVPWSTSDWKSCLKEEAGMLLSIFCPEGDLHETTKNDTEYSQRSSHDGEDI